jgi:hypothetical protein
MRSPSPCLHSSVHQNLGDGTSTIKDDNQYELTDFLDLDHARINLELLDQRKTARPRAIYEENLKLGDITRMDSSVWDRHRSPTAESLNPMLDALRSTMSFDFPQSIRDDGVSVTSGSFILGSRISDKETADCGLSTKSDSKWETTTVSESSSGNTEARFDDLPKRTLCGVRKGPLRMEIAAHARQMRKYASCWPCRMAKVMVIFPVHMSLSYGTDTIYSALSTILVTGAQNYPNHHLPIVCVLANPSKTLIICSFQASTAADYKQATGS